MSVDIVLGLGDDQLANSFQLVFPAGVPLANNSDAIALRMDQTFDPPDESVNTYDIKYRGITITKTGRSEATSKEFTIDVRIDQSWEVFKDLKRYYNACYNPVNGTGLGDSLTRFPISVQALDGDQAVAYSINFKNCKIKQMKIGSFGQEEEGPLRVTLSFIYGTMEFD